MVPLKRLPFIKLINSLIIEFSKLRQYACHPDLDINSDNVSGFELF